MKSRVKNSSNPEDAKTNTATGGSMKKESSPEKSSATSDPASAEQRGKKEPGASTAEGEL